MYDISQKAGVDNSDSPLHRLLILLTTSTTDTTVVERHHFTDSMTIDLKPLADEVTGVPGQMACVRYSSEMYHIFHQLSPSSTVVSQSDGLGGGV